MYQLSIHFHIDSFGVLFLFRIKGDSRPKYLFVNTTTLNAFILPFEHRSGADLMSKLILRHPPVRNIICFNNIGSETCSQYVDRSTEWPSGRCSDVLFAPIEVTISLPSVLVEARNTIDLKFIQRTIEYSLAVIKEHGISPIIVVFGIHPTKPSVANDLVQSDQIPYAKEYPCKPWAKSFYILDPITISSHVHEQPLKPLVAVEHFLHKQKRTLLGMDSKKRADETIQLLYTIAKQIFENDITLEERTIDVLLNVCEQTQKQFHKIKEALEIENLEELKKKKTHKRVCRRQIYVFGDMQNKVSTHIFT
ncbi:hypothetical protein RO3G_01564 [Rhizopus delemar RA 99-880]|uniref:Uncharacterized protein n=1 Tax=Rhizopus delemar (strain RA 99-880 / ATCC MYA-4621 / FGSC 9543 / NRRL 43880) TaxID=246409 RepID=I1BKY0_RHIO9|nr:hypothetical protein RO3G_01564 [Rhizopus delemar RA 99-880]|eukprot:EIE76860.1 hypothetical protein RO3G_01564 [Rhizopus delemar RA 99-880]